ncbi:MAG: TetR family transcription regulator [Amycolatopsis sp.]|jgi:AcrR family transcriptional regulator|uniref:TetR/AcrR family transcriptional regulator n=1 Tax=Amycolatopsis sp. TaxID=37632 RepID=UPI002614DAF7|nr:TetR/AcrR family transcriptional regulator [Amycolatopsis sp.]MCU1680084.1 TetR family transcription regulator [Amycolatopsis sp.]
MATVTPATGKRRAYAPRIPAAQRQAAVLDAALHLVATQGQRAVTMEAIAQLVGVTKPVVYSVFASRTDLLTALLRREHEQALHQLLAILPDDVGQRLSEDPGGALATLLADFLDAARKTPDRWHCIVMPMAEMPAEFHAAREQARSVVLARAQELANALLARIGTPPGLEPDILAQTAVALFEMAARLVLTEPETFPPDRFRASIKAVTGMLGFV